MEKKTKARLLIVGDADKGDSCLENALFYCNVSPFAIRKKNFGVCARAKNKDLTYNDFYRYNRTNDTNSLMKIYHFVLLAEPGENRDSILEHGADYLAAWLSLHDYQAVLIPHAGGSDCDIGTHWHAIINPAPINGVSCVKDEFVLFQEIIDFMNEHSEAEWSYKYACKDYFMRKTTNPFVEIYDLNDIL